MSDRYIEKSFVYVLCLSLLLHLGVFAGLYFFPSATPVPKEPVFIDLKIPPIPKQDPVKKPPPQIIKDIDKNKHYYTPPKGSQTLQETEKKHEGSAPSQAEHQRPLVESGSSVSSLLKRKKTPESPSLQKDLTLKKAVSKRIEDQIRNKLDLQKKAAGFGVDDGVDLALGSFIHRLINGVNSNLVYPPRAKSLGLEGIGIGEVTFNRNGDLIDISFSVSSGKEFDDAVIDALKKTVSGSLPKAYKEDTVTLPFVYIFQLPPQERK